MLVFVTSVRHPQNATDYPLVESLLRRTVRSLTVQTSLDSRLVVVANRPPQLPPSPHVDIVTVDFPPPSMENRAQTGRDAALWDKGTKLAVGLLAAARHGPTHLMVVDADDLVSNRLARFTNAHPAADGWYVAEGYIYSETRKVLRARRSFDEYCGTSLITRWGLWDIPTLPLTASQSEIAEAFGPTQVRDLLGSHRHAKEHFANLGYPLKPLPFPGAIYVTGTGENHSGADFRRLGRRVTPTLAHEFSLQPSTRLNAWRHPISISGVRDRIRRATRPR